MDDSPGTPSPPAPSIWHLPDGREVRFRPSCAADAPQVAAAMRTASVRTLRNRFFTELREMPPPELARRLQVDPRNEVCIVAELADHGVPTIIGGVRFVRLDRPEHAEVAITIHDRFQRQGLGTRLMQLIQPLARERGITRFVAEVLDENIAIKRLLQHWGSLQITRSGPGVAHVEWSVRPSPNREHRAAG